MSDYYLIFVHTTNLVGRTVMLTCKLLVAGKK